MMFHRFVCGKLLIMHSRTTLHHSQLLQNPHCRLRFISTISNTDELTLNYLINSCGLSPESALKASKQIVLKSTTGPDTVLSLFKTYGFTQSHISSLITNEPHVLLMNPDKTLKPKLDFFTTLGIAGPKLGKMVSADNNFLKKSLKNSLIPSIDILRSFVNADSDIPFILSRSLWIITYVKDRCGKNVAILQSHGVPRANVSKFIMRSRVLCFDSSIFENAVLQVVKMGFRPKSMMFLDGLHVLLSAKKSLWEAKLVVFQSFGWSEDEILLLFKKQPRIMATSASKINSNLDFLMNSMKWTRKDIELNPSVISLSLEKRVIPRCCVLQILLAKGALKKISMGRALRVAEHKFLKYYVIRYLHWAPDLLEVYQNKTGTPRLLVQSGDGCHMKKPIKKL